MRKFLFILSTLLFLNQQAQNYQQLTDSLTTVYTKYNLMGMSVIGICNQQIVYKKHFGKRDFTRNLNMNDSALYRIASISKNICATALMILYENGQVNLDTDIQTYLGYSVRNPNYPNTPITLRMLLSHTSTIIDGTGYGNFLDSTGAKPYAFNIQQLIQTSGTFYTSDMFTNQTIPGQYFNYANINFGIIGTIIEKVSNQRYDLFVRDSIFLPLGLTASHNVNLLPNINNVAAIYRKNTGVWQAQADNYLGIYPTPKNLNGYVLGQNGIIFSPTGGARISALDLAKYMQMHMQKGILNGIRILNDSTALLMQKQKWLYANNNGNNYYGLFRAWGLGTHITTNTANNDVIIPNKIMKGHTGEAYGLISDMYYDSARQFGFVFITNGSATPYTTPSNSAYYRQEVDIFKHLNNYLFSNCNVSNLEIITETGQLTLFPNPSETSITFRLSKDWMDKNLKIEIFNSEGKLLKQESIIYKAPTTIPLNPSNSDYYILKISTKHKNISAKFLMN